MGGGQPGSDGREDIFSAHRPYLFAVAYRLLGIAEDAEDVLQDAWLRFASAHFTELENPRAYLVSIVTRLTLDTLKSARRRREEYIGVWLPGPVRSSEALPEELAELSESASFAFLLLLEKLNPLERAVLVLHDVFDYTHEEIARMTDRQPSASRQTLRRARLKLGEPHLARPAAMDEEAVEAFVSATRAGDVQRLMSMLAPDVVLVSDGGGKVRAINRPLAGSETVARFVATLSRMEQEVETEVIRLNGQPGLVAYMDGKPDSIFVFDVTSAGITAIYVQRNPDKMGRFQFAR